MSFGLRQEDMDYLIEAIEGFAEIRKAAVFGSRAKGTYKPVSDVDIAVWGDKISFSTIARLHEALEEESPMPYFFDIVDYGQISNEKLKEHIDRVGVVIFNRQEV